MGWWVVASGGGAEGGAETPKKRSLFGNKKDDDKVKSGASVTAAEGGGGEGEEKNAIEAPKKISFVGKLFQKKQPSASPDKQGGGEVILTNPTLTPTNNNQPAT